MYFELYFVILCIFYVLKHIVHIVHILHFIIFLQSLCSMFTKMFKLSPQSLLVGCLFLTKKVPFVKGKDMKVTQAETCAYVMSAGDFSLPDSTKVRKTTVSSCLVMVRNHYALYSVVQFVSETFSSKGLGL